MSEDISDYMGGFGGSVLCADTVLPLLQSDSLQELAREL